jgi:hypothetical protein
MMIPVKQTVFTVPGGDCFAACVASILEVPLEEVPNFCAGGADWLFEANRWLGTRGLCLFDIDLADNGSLRDCHALANRMLVIASGKSPRGDWGHSVVARYVITEDGSEHALDYVHDPHPSYDYHDGPVQQITCFLATHPEKIVAVEGACGLPEECFLDLDSDEARAQRAQQRRREIELSPRRPGQSDGQQRGGG